VASQSPLTSHYVTERDKRYCLVRGLGVPLVVTTIPDAHIFKEARTAMGFND
jgi:hypothetical protein